LPDLLETVSDVGPERAEAPDRALLDRILVAAAASRAQRRRRALLAAAAAVLVAVPAGMGLQAALVRDATPPPPPSAPEAQSPLSGANPSTGVSGEGWVAVTPTGSQVSLAIRGVPAGQRCRLLVVAADGRSEQAAVWRADYAGTARVSGEVALPIAQMKWVDVVARGAVLLRVPVAPQGT
jgi:hypothetical protein